MASSILTSLRRAVTRRLRRSFIGGCAVFFFDNQLAKLRLVRGDIGTDSGAAHADWDVEDSLRYIRLVHGEYLEQAGVPGFFGRVAEVGPGDSCGVALLMLADGAEQVDLVDRFYSKRDQSYHQTVYRKLIEETPALLLAGYDADLGEDAFSGITRLYGDQASSEIFFLGRSGYDFIVSRAVMEHVTDPILSLQRMADALKPGGRLLHVVDLRDHGMFTQYDFPELKFLGVPPLLYRQMTAETGRPNRAPLRLYREAFPQAAFKVTHLVGYGHLPEPMAYNEIPPAVRSEAVAAVAAQRGLLHPSFRSEADEDLAVSGFFMVFRKEEDAAPRAAAG